MAEYRPVRKNAAWYNMPQRGLRHVVVSVTTPDMEPRDLLQAWLKASDISAAELARKLEYDPSNMSKLLKGTIRPTLDMAFKIEGVTGGAVPAAAWAQAA